MFNVPYSSLSPLKHHDRTESRTVSRGRLSNTYIAYLYVDHSRSQNSIGQYEMVMVYDGLPPRNVQCYYRRTVLFCREIWHLSSEELNETNCKIAELLGSRMISY